MREVTLTFPKPNCKKDRRARKQDKIEKRDTFRHEALRLSHGKCLFCKARGIDRPATQTHHCGYGAGGRVERDVNDFIPCCNQCHDIANPKLQWSTDKGTGLKDRPFVLWSLQRLNEPRFNRVIGELQARCQEVAA